MLVQCSTSSSSLETCSGKSDVYGCVGSFSIVRSERFTDTRRLTALTCRTNTTVCSMSFSELDVYSLYF